MDGTGDDEPPGAADTAPRARGLKRLVALLVAPGLVLAVELGLRAEGFRYEAVEVPIQIWNPNRDEALRAENQLHRFDPISLWSPLPGALVPYGPGPDGGDERISASGFRGRDPDPAAAPRVVVLGDSSTFGMGAPLEKTYAAGLERRLRERSGRDAQVLNAGVIGFTIAQGLARYEHLCSAWKPNVVVIAFGAVNEHFPSVPFDDVEKMAFVSARDGTFARLGRSMREDLRVLQLFSYLEDQARGGRQAILLDLAKRSIEDIRRRNHYLEVPEYPRRVSTEVFRITLGEFLAAARRDGARLVLVGMPRRAEAERRLPPILDYDPVLRDFAREQGLPLVDVREVFQQRVREGVEERAFLRDEFHPTPEGHEIVAELLDRAIAPLLGD